MAINIFVILHIFPSNRGVVLAKFPEIFHGNKVDKCVQHSGVLQGYKYILFGQMSVISQKHPTPLLQAKSVQTQFLTIKCHF